MFPSEQKTNDWDRYYSQVHWVYLCVYFRWSSEISKVSIYWIISKVTFTEKYLVLNQQQQKKTIISYTGDYNTDPASIIGSEMFQCSFKQIILHPTHIGGNVIDHCYISDNIRTENEILVRSLLARSTQTQNKTLTQKRNSSLS